MIASVDEHDYMLAKKHAQVLRISGEALPMLGQGSWMKFAGLVETGDPQSSQSIDELVYGHQD